MNSSLTNDLPAAARARPAALPRPRFDWLSLVAILAVAGTFVRALWFTPEDALQGPAQKILYVHATAAFVGLYLACGLTAFASLAYLWLRDERADRLAESAAEVAFIFLSVVLVTGPIWGKPIWGTWWTWDARLTLTLFLWFVVVGYLVMRGAIEDHAMRARYSAVLGILAAVLVPFIHLSVYLFRTLHPMPIVLKPSTPSMSREMGETFALAFASFTLLFVAFLRSRYALSGELAELERRLAAADSPEAR
ncbi:MAG: cytochrome c biogenesis protein CcsA [Gemmatimonadaceae bacterium]